MRNLLILFAIFLGILVTSVCLADVVYLKNGSKLEADTRETEEGVWVGGVLFLRSEIKYIEKKEYVKLEEKFGLDVDDNGASWNAASSSEKVKVAKVLSRDMGKTYEYWVTALEVFYSSDPRALYYKIHDVAFLLLLQEQGSLK